MKSAWTRLAKLILKQGGDTKFMEPRFDNLFLRHHHNASELLTNKDGKPLAALYFTPTGMHQEEVKNILRLARERMHWSGDDRS